MGFEKICEAARTFNQPILDMLLKEATYIDEWKPWTWFHSAVTQMALENRKNSVDFLLNKYDANINLAAKGAILGSAEHPELLNLVEELLAKGANPNLLACFAIQAGQIDYAESMEARFNININFLAEGAGLANNADYWKKCEARGAHMSYFYSGKAKAGHLTVQEILSLDPTAFNLDLILAVFCFENQKNQIDKLFRNHINPTNIAFAAVLYGDLPYALSLTKDVFSEQLMRIASMVGRWDYVKTGKDRIKKRGDMQKQEFYKFYLMGMAAGGHARILIFINNIHDPGLLKLFVSEAARNGHDKLAEQICALKGKEFYSALLEGSAKGGHDIPIEKWRGKGNNEIGPLVLNTASANHVTLTRKYFALDENAGMMAILGSAKGCNSQFYLKELQHRFPGNLGVFMRRAAESNYLPFVKSMLTLLLKTIEQNTFPVLQTILENFLEITAAAAISIKQDFKTNLSHQLYYLSFYQPAHIPLLVKGFEMWNLSISIAIVERATEISRLVMRDEMDYYQALYITEPQCQSLRYLLMMLLLKEKNHTGLPLDIWLHITNFITPIPLNANDYQFTGMRDAKACIEIQLKKAGFLQKDSPHRAHTFFNTLSQAKTCTDMKNTIAEAASAEKSALHADRFSEQIESWNMRFNG